MRDRNLLILIQAPYFEDYGPMRKAAGVYFPLGIGSISGYVKQHGYDVRFFDPNVQHQSPEELGRLVAESGATLVGISFMTPQFRIAAKIAEAIRSAAPDVRIVLGGAHPSVVPEETLGDIPAADFVAVGEAEETVRELLDVLTGRSAAPIDSIAGLVWRDGERVVVNASRQPFEDLDALPWPDRSLIDQSLYQAQGFLSYSKKAAAIHTSRGCPARCVFCASGHKLAARVRERSIANVMDEIDFLRSRFGIDYLLIKDDTFTFKRGRVREFCAEIKDRHPGLKWHCMGRINTVNEELLSEMKAAGLNDIFYGIESGNDSVLRQAGKNLKTSRVRQVVGATAKLGIRSYGAFILGLPGDSRETIEQTIQFACSLPLTMAGFSILIPYPGTKVYDDHYRDTHEAATDYSQFIASTGMHYVDGYTGLVDMEVSELPKLVAEAQRRFYMRPRQVVRMLGAATPAMVGGYLRGFASLVSKEIHLRLRPAVARG